MPSQMVQRLIKRFEHYERETKGILECYDELEFNYDYLQKEYDQSQRENENLKHQIQMMLAEKASKDYSKVHRVVPA